MADDDDSTDSDGWGAEELVIPPVGTKDNTSNGKSNDDGENDLGDDYWKVETKKPVAQDSIKEPAADETKEQASSCMIIVDLTQMDPNIHSKFDRNSVNQPEQASALRKKIEQNYREYAFSNTLLSEGTVIPCGSSVWRGALVKLRDDRTGHYFVPIFAPNNSAS